MSGDIGSGRRVDLGRLCRRGLDGRTLDPTLG